MKKKIGVLGLLMLLSIATMYGQVKVNGKIFSSDQKSLPGVGIIITNTKDTTDKTLTTSDINGNFSASVRANSSFVLKTSYVGFDEVKRPFQTSTKDINLGSVVIKQKSKLLDEVVIEGQKTPVVQKGDTTEMSASAYKVNVDANAQDLVTKMPGVTVENGTIKAHGEEVKRVLLDGKNFFGEDASMALQNLPAEVIDKVQVYNKQSDQSEFTGFDDGNSSKVLNIITRADRRKGENGTLTAGHDYQDKYLANGRLNVFRQDRRLTITGGMNNVNQQNFSSMDLLSGGGRGGRGGGMYMGRQSGLNKPASLGINYSDALGTKGNLSGSYFFNKQDNYTESLTNQENINSIVSTDVLPRYQNSISNSNFQNFNHRFDMRLEYNLDSANSIVFAPRFSTQQNNSRSFSDQLKYNIQDDTTYFINNNNNNDGYGMNYSGDLTLRHKFSKRGRTISLGFNGSGNEQKSDGANYSFTRSPKDTAIIDLNSNSDTKGTTVSGNLAYTEPVGSNGILMFAYNARFNKNSTDKKSYDQLNNDSLSTRYSNVYNNNYNTQSAGITYQVRAGEKMNASAGVDYQYADLTGEKTFPGKSNVNRTFENVLPNFMLNYKFSQKSNLRMMYRTSTNPPSVNQLQDVFTASSSMYINQGNPNLGHEYTHNGRLNYRFSNSEKFTNFGVNLFGSYTQNSIANAIYYVSSDSTMFQALEGGKQDTIVLQKGGQLTKPENFGGSWSTRMFFNYGFLFKPIKCNLNYIGGVGFSTYPGSVNNILRTTNSYNITSGLVVASNISQNVDFTLSYMGSYNLSTVHNSGDLGVLASRIKSTNSETWNHSITLNSTVTLLNSIVVRNTVNEQINAGLGSFNQNFLVWNASIGVKVFKNKAGQITLNGYDLLNQTKNVIHSVSTTAISDSRTNTLQRYFLLTFTYTLRNYQSGGDGERHGFGEGRGGFGGGERRGFGGGGYGPGGGGF